ncbi:MAG: AtpZ/AtpI family protein [Pseudomonadota bacterium]
MADDREDRLNALDARLSEAKARQAPPPKLEEHYSQAQQGWRMVTELVSGLLIGFGIGYGADVLFGTMPIFLVLFTLLGFAAGVNVMVRTAREIQERQEADEGPKNGDDARGGRS